MFWLAHSAWAVLQLGLVTWVQLDRVNSHYPQVSPALRAALSQADSGSWYYHMGTWDGWSRVWHFLWSTGLTQQICLRKSAERVVRGAWQGHTCSVELEGRKKSSILGSSWTPVMSYPVVSHSGAMGCHGDLFSPTFNLFKGTLFLLCSLWRGDVTPDILGFAAWLCWVGSKILVLMQGSLDSLEIFWFFLFLGFSLGFSCPCFCKNTKLSCWYSGCHEMQDGQMHTTHSITAVPLALCGLPTPDSAAPSPSYFSPEK